jgi:hypothetical protein
VNWTVSGETVLGTTIGVTGQSFSLTLDLARMGIVASVYDRKMVTSTGTTSLGQVNLTGMTSLTIPFSINAQDCAYCNCPGNRIWSPPARRARSA